MMNWRDPHPEMGPMPDTYGPKSGTLRGAEKTPSVGSAVEALDIPGAVDMNKSHNLRGHFARHPGGQPGGQHPVNANKSMSSPTHHATGVVAADRALKNKPPLTEPLPAGAGPGYEAQYGKGAISSGMTRATKKKKFSTFPIYGPDTGPY